MDKRGEEVETWQDDNKLSLINSPDDPSTFYSRRWHTTSTHDLAFCTDDIQGHVKREVGEQLGGSDHRPIHLIMDPIATASSTIPRWNYKKANWTLYRNLSNEFGKDTRVESRDFNKAVKDFQH